MFIATNIYIHYMYIYIIYMYIRKIIYTIYTVHNVVVYKYIYILK